MENVDTRIHERRTHGVALQYYQRWNFRLSPHELSQIIYFGKLPGFALNMPRTI